MTMNKADQQLADELAKYYNDPLGYVLFAFPWDDPNSGIGLVPLQGKYKERFPNCVFGPDLWACEFLDELGEQIKKRKFDGVKMRGINPDTGRGWGPIRFATASGHGIGKSVLVALLIKFILDTRPLSVGTVTATTADQLKNKTWSELGKWHKLSITAHWYDYNSTKGNMALRHKDRPEDWKCTGVTCKEENSESFAGQHALGGTSFYIFDEASGVPDKIFEVRDGGLTDGEPMVFDFGNPTRNSGRFFENCIGKHAHRYITRSIDSRDVFITNKDYFQQMVDDYGEDSDYVRVRVRGLFPRQGSLEFIGIGDVNEAIARPVAYDRAAPLIIGVDVAAFGDDESVIYPRIGHDARSWKFRRFRGLDSIELADQVSQMVEEFRSLGKDVTAVFIDRTGIGQGCYDSLMRRNFNVIGVNFGNRAIDNQTYRYRPDEMWGKLKDAIRNGLCLPDDNDLKDQLSQRYYGYTLSQQIWLEPKKEMKKRGLNSPDIADALALTYAQEMAPIAERNSRLSAPLFIKHDFDPLEF